MTAPHFTYRVPSDAALHPLLALGARQGASDIHLASSEDTGKQWMQVDVDAVRGSKVPFVGNLKAMMTEVLDTTPLELDTPDKVFLHALGSAPASEGPLVLLDVEAMVGNTMTRWGLLYATKREGTGFDYAVFAKFIHDTPPLYEVQ